MSLLCKYVVYINFRVRAPQNTATEEILHLCRRTHKADIHFQICVRVCACVCVCVGIYMFLACAAAAASHRTWGDKGVLSCVFESRGNTVTVNRSNNLWNLELWACRTSFQSKVFGSVIKRRKVTQTTHKRLMMAKIKGESCHLPRGDSAVSPLILMLGTHFSTPWVQDAKILSSWKHSTSPKFSSLRPHYRHQQSKYELQTERQDFVNCSVANHALFWFYTTNNLFSIVSVTVFNFKGLLFCINSGDITLDRTTTEKDSLQ